MFKELLTGLHDSRLSLKIDVLIGTRNDVAILGGARLGFTRVLNACLVAGSYEDQTSVVGRFSI